MAKEFGVAPHYKVLPRWMLQVAGLSNGIIRESVEMLYQNGSDYLFDSSKFEKAFNLKPTPYSQGIHETVLSMK